MRNEPAPPNARDTHQCCCVLVSWDGREKQCADMCVGPDSPFCEPCEENHQGPNPRVRSAEKGTKVTRRLMVRKS